MKKTTLFAAVACAALLSFHTDALDLTLKNGRELPNVTIVNTAKNRVTLVTTASNGVSTLRSIRFSEFSDQSLNALKQYFMENINSYMEPARSEKRANFNALQNLQQYSAAQQQNSNALQQQVLFSAAPAIRFSQAGFPESGYDSSGSTAGRRNDGSADHSADISAQYQFSFPGDDYRRKSRYCDLGK